MKALHWIKILLLASALAITSLPANAQRIPVVVSPAQPSAFQPFKIDFNGLDASNHPPEPDVYVSGKTITIEYGVLGGIIIRPTLPPPNPLSATVEGVPAGVYTIKFVRRMPDGKTNQDRFTNPVSLTVSSAPTPQPVYALYRYGNGYLIMVSAAERDEKLKQDWVISDQGFNVWPAAGPAPDTAHPVCKFSDRSIPFLYTADAAECETFKQIEGLTYDIAFRALAPTAGACLAGTTPVWRLYNYNDKPGVPTYPPYRYIASAETYRAMITDGWRGDGIAFCSPDTNTTAVAGAWYDPAYDGSGFNMTMTPAGLIVYYYGWDRNGNRLWLMSDIGPTTITPGETLTLPMRVTNGGRFETPAKPSTLSQWGSLKINFTSCTKATATLSGSDGTSVMNNLQMLAGEVNMPPC
jgi:hypothetical protein